MDTKIVGKDFETILFFKDHIHSTIWTLKCLSHYDRFRIEEVLKTIQKGQFTFVFSEAKNYNG
jgi:hypothetical protein